MIYRKRPTPYRVRSIRPPRPVAVCVRPVLRLLLAVVQRDRDDWKVVT